MEAQSGDLHQLEPGSTEALMLNIRAAICEMTVP